MFEYTTEGYNEAIEFLKETRNLHLIEKELSVDGYTIVSLANNIKLNFEGPDQVSTWWDRIMALDKKVLKIKIYKRKR